MLLATQTIYTCCMLYIKGVGRGRVAKGEGRRASVILFTTLAHTVICVQLLDTTHTPSFSYL